MWNMDNQGQEVWFAEDQGQYVVTTMNAYELQKLAHDRGVPCELIGFTSGSVIRWKESGSVPLTALREASDGFFRDWMES